jgi:hypothetical protein
MWRITGASVIGTSHLANGTLCQDTNWVTRGHPRDPWPMLCMFAADGAGSACRGREGAELAVLTTSEFLRERCAEPGFIPTASLLRECVGVVRDRIHKAASEEGMTPRDYACTFLGLVSMESGTAIVQIGDGGVVVDFGGGLQLPIVPMNGEYANMTYFVSDDDSVERAETREIASMVLKAAVFTDGIQRLCINLGRNEPHEPFFRDFFAVLATSTQEEEINLQDKLVEFLGSDAVNSRTDDDRTLLLASEVPG